MKATYDQQIEDFSRSILVEKKNLQSELARTKLEYELQLELMNEKVTKLQVEHKGGISSDELKSVMQDIYSNICEYFNPDGDDSDVVQFSVNDVLKRLRIVLKRISNNS